MKQAIQRQLEHHELMAWVESAETPEEMQERADHASQGYPVFVTEEVEDTNPPPRRKRPLKNKRQCANRRGYRG